MAKLDGTDDVFDSRDVIERIKELDISGDDEDKEEYDALVAFRDEMETQVADWPYGETFILDDYFRQYAIELASDISSDISPTVADSWPFCHIDWDAAADSLKQDYTSCEFMGYTYWVRA